MVDHCLLAGLCWLILSNIVNSADPLPVVRWDFGSEESTPLQSVGGVHRDIPGPRAPDYPDFDANNTAIRLDGQGAHLSFDDTGTSSPYDFTNGNSITVEAWVQVDELKSGENVYVIGKGRTGSEGFVADNQNWALRVREVNGKAGISFLFATPKLPDPPKSDSHWHRWTSVAGFTTGKGWHHIAVSYRFGDSKSLLAWIDGQPQSGSWDMGGATDQSPIVDDDAIWIGSAQKGAASNSFRGGLDSIAVYRQMLDDSSMKTRYRFAGTEIVDVPAPEMMPAFDALEPGKVLYTFHEGLPSHSRWLFVGESFPAETMRLQSETYLLDRLPQRYDTWGIRENWKAPVLVRIAADVQLPPGQHRFLMRVRGLSRLWVDGQVIARSLPLAGSPSGEEPMTPVPEPPRPGLRLPEHRQQEILAEATIAEATIGEATIGESGRCRVVLETIVGGKNFRTDPGEICVASQTVDGASFALLPNVVEGPNQILLTDSDVTAALARQELTFSLYDDQSRRVAAASQDAFWKSRHDASRDWAALNPAPPVPSGYSHPVDAFLETKIATALAESAKTPIDVAKLFNSGVFPILRDKCFRCHGEKKNGGLRLDAREAAVKAGDSGIPAIIPGDVAQGELLRRIRSADPEERMPPGDKALSDEQITQIESWIGNMAVWPAPPVTEADVASAGRLGDSEFLRRVYLDTIGLPPTEAETRAFLSDSSAGKRIQLIDRLLADERGADHWISYWQDVLAENPTMLNSSLNTTGPFRWFLYDSLRDNKPLDRMVSELIMLRGSPHEGGSAGFGIAADNDAPFAAKGQIVAHAFLGIELQCARCHDSPYHSTKQRDLYSLAAMFENKPVTVPKSSRVPLAFFEHKVRESLIQVTLKPDDVVEPTWPFSEVTGAVDDQTLTPLLQNPDDSRERLAALITSPKNTRFAQVIVNRVWRRFLGAGFVEPAHDWEGHAPSHPALLEWLAREFVIHDYDLKHVVRLILTSDVYQRAATGQNLNASPELRFFAAPDRRRLTAEQIVDSLHQAGGHKMNVEEFTFDPDGRRPSSNRLTLGIPRRAWMFASLANERDRPTLSLPRAQAVADLLEAFGWTGSRQNPRSDRETSPNVLQPGVMANSTASVLLTRASVGSGLADLAVSADSPQNLVDSVFLRYLNRYPTASEKSLLSSELEAGFHERVLALSEVPPPQESQPLEKVTWSNHLRPEGNLVALELEHRARTGTPADQRLRAEWREVYEDTIWSLINIREFVWMP